MNAVLVVAHFVISIFGTQIGDPAIQYIAYPTIDVCLQYAQFTKAQIQLNSEYVLVKQTQCVTMEEFQQYMGLQPQ